ncbi:unnamed protein product [Linum trigynum]|uniref:Protein saal1 n=1 Tax=Linum trigynum TaxID=586398 RepID=A0AAV2G0F9_9ROSI
MALSSRLNPAEEEENELDDFERPGEEEEEAAAAGEEPGDQPSHNPSAPPDELFDISTTVDPAYIISLIRKLVPINASEAVYSRDNGLSCNDGVRGGSTSGRMDDSGASLSRELVLNESDKNEPENMDVGDVDSSCRSQVTSVSQADDVWEEHGCVLWDLAASKMHAELMVQNLVLEVLSANLIVSQSVRVKEICLGIIGNLGCHELPMMHIVSKEGLMKSIIDQLFLDDTQCLCEVFRIFTSGLKSKECGTWCEALEADHVLSRIMWVAENTLNLQLLEKSVEFLIAVLECREEVSSALIPPFMKLGLSSLLIHLLSTEMSVATGDKVPERLPILDVILRAIEALSSLDGHSQEISSNKTLFLLVCDVLKMPDKAEVASSCVTAAVLFANMLADIPTLSSEICQDVSLLEGLLDILSFASDDLEAQHAIWSTIAILLVQVKETEMTISSLHQYVTVLVSKSDLIEDNFLGQQIDHVTMENSDSSRRNARSIALLSIVGILTKWTSSKDRPKRDGTSSDEHNAEYENIRRLMRCCHKHLGVELSP